MKRPGRPRVSRVSCADLNPFTRMFKEFFDFPRSALYLGNLFMCARNNDSMESCYTNEKGMTPDSFFNHIRTPVMDGMIDACNNMLRESFRRLNMECKNRYNSVRYLAIDTNDTEYWGAPDIYVIKKRGVTKNIHVLSYATVCIVDHGFRYTLAVLPVMNTDKPAVIVERLLSMALDMVEADTVLLDRGFYNTDAMKLIRGKGMDFIIPMRKSDDTDQTFKTSCVLEKWSWIYTLYPGHEKETRVYLYLRKDSRREYIGCVSSKQVDKNDIDMIFETYRLRWNIEISYKEKNRYLVRTSSPNKVYRLLLYTVSHLLMNILQCIRHANNSFFRFHEMKKLVPYLLKDRKAKKLRLTKTLLVIF